MKRIITNILLAALLTGGLAGCYNDKGNYDYRDINEMSFTIKATDANGTERPIDEDGYARYKQPSGEPLVMNFTPVVSQTMHEGEDNLEYYWEYYADQQKVTSTEKVLTITFPANQASSYSVRCSVTDNTTNITFYKSLSLQTVEPYQNSWLVLNGSDKNRLLSAVEDPDSVEYIQTKDAYTDMGYTDGEEIFGSAIDLVYSADLNYSKAASPEILHVLTEDKVYEMFPFDLKATEMKLPFESGIKNAYGIDGTVMNGSGTTIVNTNQRFCFSVSSSDGKTTFVQPTSKDFPNYLAICVGVPSNSRIPFWDGDACRFMYVYMDEYSEVQAYDDASDWKDAEVLWMGAAPKVFDDYKSLYGMALVRMNSTYYACYLDAENGIERHSIAESVLEGLDKDSKFATAPMAFEDQFFYTAGSKLYRVNILSGQSTLVYEAAGKITQLQFRTLFQNSGKDDDYRTLGLAVSLGEDEGELDQITLTTAGDLDASKTKKFTGFGNILDICYTFCNRVIR